MIILPVYLFNKIASSFRYWHMDTIYYPKYDWLLRAHTIKRSPMPKEMFNEQKETKVYERIYKSHTT